MQKMQEKNIGLWDKTQANTCKKKHGQEKYSLALCTMLQSKCRRKDAWAREKKIPGTIRHLLRKWKLGFSKP
jgi:hypothetical protein